MTTDRVVRITSFVDWIQFHMTTKHAGRMHQKHDSDCVITEYAGRGEGNKGSGVVIGVQVGI